MDMSFTIQNAKKITEGLDTDNPKVTYLNSTFRHECVTHKLSNGDVVMVDGGNSFSDGGYYGRGSVYKLPPETIVENYSLNEGSSFQEICEKLLWGTRGKFSNEHFRWVRLADCSIDHLKAMLQTQTGMAGLHRAVAQFWLKKKEEDMF